MKLFTPILAAALVACGGTSAPTKTATLRPACADGNGWNGSQCAPWGAGAATLSRGEKALKDGLLDDALASFKKAVTEGPHTYPTHVRLYEQLGIANAYREDDPAAMLAFGRLLLLAPRHLLSYRLSPTATLKFEQAQRASAKSAPPTVDVSWPDDLDVAKPIRIQIEVVADPAKMLNLATLYIRDANANEPARAVDVELAPSGERTAVTLPALGGDKPRKLSLHLVARDQLRNEVLRWASVEDPRTMSVTYTPPPPLWKRPWPYVVGGIALASVVGAVAYLVARPLPDNVGGGGTLPGFR